MPNEPNNWDDFEDCVTFTWCPGMDPPHSYWNDDTCHKTNGFVCEAYLEQFHVADDPWPSTGGCKDGWTVFGGGCYRRRFL